MDSTSVSPNRPAHSASLREDQTVYPVRMPIDGPVSDLGEAVQKLKQCPTDELQRARRHHRRAIEALDHGGYSALPEAKRNELLKRLQMDLEALNQALAEKENALNEHSEQGSDASPEMRAFSHQGATSFLRDLLSWSS